MSAAFKQVYATVQLCLAPGSKLPQKQITRLVVLVCFALCCSSLLASDREAGAFFLQQYSPKTYAASPQNWAVAQDQRGIMYFGNTEGVLEYDGANWRKIILQGERPALSLTVDKSGIIFVGSENEFGFLKSDANGVLQYSSLLNEVPTSSRNFGNISSIAENSAGVWFQSRKHLFCWNPKKGISVISGQAYGRLFPLSRDIFVEVRHYGLHQIIGEALVPIPGGILPDDPAIQGVFKLRGSVVVATNADLFQAHDSRMLKLQLPASKQLRDAQGRSFLSLKNGEVAVGSAHSGVLILNAAGDLDRVVSREEDLRSALVRDVFEDRQGGIWLALDRGLARLDFDRPITTFGEHEGVSEMVTGLERQGDTLYAGTAVGLSYLKPSEGGKAAHFESVIGIENIIPALLPTKYGLMAGGSGGIWEVHGNSAALVSSSHQYIYDLAPSIHDSDVMFAAGRDGVSIFRRSATTWEPIQRINAESIYLRTVLEDTDGWLWLTSRSRVLRVDWRQDPAKVERYELKDGVPAGWINAYRVNGRIVFTSNKGLLRFDGKQNRFVPDTSFGKEFADGSRPVSLIRESPGGEIWITGQGYHGLLLGSGSARNSWVPDPLERAGIKELYTLLFDRDGTIWASGMDGGLARSRRINEPPPALASVQIRQIEAIPSSRVIYGGAHALSLPLVLRHAENALRFSFASPSYGDEGNIQYQVRLDGLDNSWSSWSTDPQKEYTNLFEKPYRFHVRARIGDGEPSGITEYSFRVLPPWYRNWLAYLAYLVLLLGTILLFIKWRLAQVNARNRNLERIVEERTEEIRLQRDEIQKQEAETEALLLNILPQPIAAELRTTGAVNPLLFHEVAVCFTDFVGFTLSSEEMPAPDLVRKLDRYFTAFDKVIEKFGLEKLKTIGDAYMFVGGLPTPKPSYAVDTVMAALELVKVVEDLAKADPSSPWRVRVGIHCGPAIAGVVGVKKFAFDIWGETVNRAARMESCSKPNLVNISQETFEQVKGLIRCEARGPIATKEGRYFDMFFALEPEQDVNGASFADRYQAAFGTKPPHAIGAARFEFVPQLERT